MSITNHPDTEQLNAYIRNPAADDYRQLRLHLMKCTDCRSEVDLLMNLQNHFAELADENPQEMMIDSDDANGILHAQMIKNYIDGQLDERQKQQLVNMLKDNTYAMKSALHYAGHSENMNRAIDKGDGSGIGRNTSDGLLNMLGSWVSARMPVWLAVPVTAVMAGVLTVVMIPQFGNMTSKHSIVAYQDNPVIQFKRTQNLPGIGFFSSANKTAQPYGKMNVTLSHGQMVKLHWPEVNDAEKYTVHLKIFKSGKQLSVGKQTTSKTQATFKREAGDTGHRYVWNLSGKTRTGQLFSTKGGFIIDTGNK